MVSGIVEDILEPETRFNSSMERRPTPQSVSDSIELGERALKLSCWTEFRSLIKHQTREVVVPPRRDGGNAFRS
jgi:hypothetical protein